MYFLGKIIRVKLICTRKLKLKLVCTCKTNRFEQLRAAVAIATRSMITALKNL